SAYLLLSYFSLCTPPPPRSTLFPYTTLFRSDDAWIGQPDTLAASLELTAAGGQHVADVLRRGPVGKGDGVAARPLEDVDWGSVLDRKSTRLNSSHVSISYAVFCLKKKKQTIN